MNKLLCMTALMLAFSGSAMAGTGLACKDMANSESFETDAQFSQCLTQTDQELNGSFQALKKKMKDRNVANDLKTMQLGWIKMRDAQCIVEALTANLANGMEYREKTCKIRMTTERTDQLDAIADKL
ncbi:lysozyme inhibitor LprI family protein [Thiothrix lacustris]|uniref:lysozyme inhibitor LprI family protein n=1 Tax=Thiothrix lacustris TaxID=525917 RepID=UPI00048BFD98|nr:lysozyme inhibitor LprI family protein [Thiothrix lacustris]